MIADVLEAAGVERVADGADAPVHHVGRGDDVGAGGGLQDGRRATCATVSSLTIIAVAQNAVMAMAGERIERDIGDDADLRHGRP